MKAGLAGRARAVAFAAVVALAVLGAGIGYAAIPDSSGVVHACFAKRDGALRVIDTDAGGVCNTSKETAVDWNRTGPQGSTGAQGSTGPQGATGPAGPDARTVDVVVREGEPSYVFESGGVHYTFECGFYPIITMEPPELGMIDLSGDGRRGLDVVFWDQSSVPFARVTGDGIVSVHGIVRVVDPATNRGGAYTHLDLEAGASHQAAGSVCNFSGMLFGSTAS